MPSFPAVERIEFETPPLELVICQVRFPVALALVSSPPADFQHRFRDLYPVASPRRHRNMVIDSGGSPQIQESRFWSFEDAAGLWTISLGADFLALETKQYRSFAEFLDRFCNALGAVQELYSIRLRERIGLRYLDRMSTTRIPSFPHDWIDQVRPDLLPLRGAHAPGDQQYHRTETVFRFDGSTLAIRSEYADAADLGTTERAELLLDFDCFREGRASLDGLPVLLRGYHDVTYRAFRWAIGRLAEVIPQKPS